MDHSDPQQTKRPHVVCAGNAHWGLIWGFVILIVGVSLLLDHMGIISFGYVYRLWPLILVVFGLMNLASRNSRVLGVLLLAAGVLFLLNNLNLIRFTFGDLWPVAIIAVGLVLIWGSLENRGLLRKKPKFDWTQPNAAAAFRQRVVDAFSETESSMNAVAVFGGHERRCTDQHFQGGKVTSIFGGVEIDFRDADIDGEAVLEVTCIFGGVELRVPDTWYVHSRTLPVFGSFEDKTRQSRVAQPEGAKRKTLIVTGVVVFGSVEIMN
ncbi:MAG: LiaF transmembrane domain-containing protein [Candidatus Acidiferrum sp.]